MRKILVLNRLPQNMAPYRQWFEGHNIEWTMLGWEDISASYDSHENASFYKNYANEKFTKDAYEYCKKNRPFAIINTSEFDVVRAGQLRDKFGIQGQTADNALLYRDKIAMKTRAATKGINVPKFIHARNTIQVLDFIDKNGYPVIIKPVSGAGTVDVNLVRNEEQLNIFLDNNIIEELDVESYVDGKLYHIDGLILDGEFKVIWPHSYNNDSTLGFAHGEHQGSYTLDEKNPLTPRLITFAKDVVRALDIHDVGTFHCEVFHTNDDDIVLCEVAGRLGGGRMVPVLNAAFNADLYQYWVKAQAGIPQDIPFKSTPDKMAGHLLYLPKGGTYKGPTTFEQLSWVDELLINVKPGKSYGANSSVDFAGSAVVTGESEQEVRAKLAEVESIFDRYMIWESE